MTAGAHLDRLSGLDASFLEQERDGSHMHIGAVFLFEGEPPTRDELVDQITSRLHLVPRYRQKLAFPKGEIGRPLWVDDPRFNVDYHVRHTSLPAPGTIEELRLLAGRVFSQRLDRSKPLWEIWLAQGLQDGGFALLSKSHHALVDGISGIDLFTVLLDPSAQAPPVVSTPPEWAPAPEPSQAQLVADGLKDVALRPLAALGGVLRAVRDPGHALDEARDAAQNVGELAWNYLNPAPATPLNVPIGPHRNIRWVNSSLADLKGIKNELGGTINDVLVSVVSGALRTWLQSRGIRTEGLELRGCVPISIRADDADAGTGTRIGAAFAPLPVYVGDPVERLGIVRRELSDVKESRQALGAQAISEVRDFAPSTLLAQASRLSFSTRFYNLLVTNVPGPQFPLYLLGCRLAHAIPVAFLSPNMALAVAIMSYDGKVEISLITDYDALPDIDAFASYVEDEIDLLRLAAGVRADAA